MDQQVISITKAIDQCENVDEINDLLDMFLNDVHSLFSFEQSFVDSNSKAFIENSFKSVLRACTTKIKNYKDIALQYEDELRLSREKFEIVRFENQLCQNKILDLTAQVNQLQSYLNEADTKVNLLHSDILYLIEENKLLADSLQNLKERSETTEGKDENLSSGEDYELKIANYRAEINRLRHDAADQSILIEKLQKDLKVALANNSELKKNKQELTQKMGSVRAKKRKLKEENHFLREELKTATTLGMIKREDSEEVEKENKNKLATTTRTSIGSTSEGSETRERKFSLISDVMSSTNNANKTNQSTLRYSLEDEPLSTNYLKMLQSKSQESIHSETDEFLNKGMSSYTDLFMKEKVLVKWDEGDFPRLKSLNSRGWSSTSIKELSMRKMDSYKSVRDGMVLPSQKDLLRSSSTKISSENKEDVLLNEKGNQENLLLKDKEGESSLQDTKKCSSEQTKDLKSGVVCSQGNKSQSSVIMSFFVLIMIMFFFPFSIINPVIHKLRNRTIRTYQ